MNPNESRPDQKVEAVSESAGSGSDSRIAVQRTTTPLPFELLSAEDLAPKTLEIISANLPVSATWWQDFHAAVEILAKTGRSFTSDDVRPFKIGEPAHVNLWGSAFGAAHRRGVIEPVGATRSARRSRSGGLNQMWIGTAAGREEVAS